MSAKAADKQLGDILGVAFPRAFQRMERNGDMYFEAASTWSGAKRLFAYVNGHEFVVVLEIDIPLSAPIRNQTLGSEAALLMVGCLCSRLQAHGFDVGLLADRGLVSGLLVSTRLCRDHATTPEFKERLAMMRGLASRVDAALRSPNDAIRFLWIGLQPGVGVAIAPSTRQVRRGQQLRARRTPTRRPKRKALVQL